MFVSVRTYRVRSGWIDALTHRVDRDLADAFAQEPGFVAYQVVRTGSRTVASITTFREREQAEASNELAAQWVADALADFEVERMGVIGGEVMVSRALADMLEPGHEPDAWGPGDRIRRGRLARMDADAAAVITCSPEQAGRPVGDLAGAERRPGVRVLRRARSFRSRPRRAAGRAP